MAPEPQNFEDRTHSDFGALQQRVAGTESRLNEIATSVGQLRTETRTQIVELSSSLGGAISRLSESFNNSRNTNWSSFFQTAAAVLGIGMTIGAAVLIPMNANIGRNDAAIEQIRDTRFSHEDAVKMRDELVHYTEVVSNRSVTHAEFDEVIRREDDLRAQNKEYRTANLQRIEKQLDQLATNSAADTQAAEYRSNERINMVVGSLNELRHDYGASFTVGDRIKGLENEIADLRRANAAADTAAAATTAAAVAAASAATRSVAPSR